MIADINLLQVLIAAVAAFAVGALWYSPLLFMSSWTTETGIDPNAEIENPAVVYGLTFVYTLLSSAALAILIGPDPQWVNAFQTSVLVAVAIVATSLGINYQFVRNSTKHWLIDSGFHIARFLVIAVVLCI